MKIGIRSALVTVCLGLTPHLHAQEAVSPTPTTAAAAPQSTPASEARRDSNRDLFPSLNLYLPEGEVDIKTRKLIRNVLLESQIQYKFVDGDVSTYLRYKYYARDFTYKLGVFDTIEFSPVQSGDRSFDRVRGGLLLFEYPGNYNQRYFFLTQLDGLTYSDGRADNDRNNLYFKLAYQQGTPFDERLNSIVGESRGRVTPVLTAFRDIGPQKLGLAAAITQGVDQIGGDYRYTKFEAEGLKRSDFSESLFLISRLHVGSMLQKERVACSPGDEDCTLGEVEPRPFSESFSLPRYEMFRIGGRESLKGVDDQPRGTDEAHLSNEFFFPVFRNRNYRFLGSRWTNMYGIAYAGAGVCKCDSGRVEDLSEEVISGLSDVVADAGLGFESSLTIRNYDIYMSVLYAKTIAAPANLEGQEIRFSVRTSR